MSILESIEKLRGLFSEISFDNFLNQVQPVITKVKPTDEQFDIEYQQSIIMQKMTNALEKI